MSRQGPLLTLGAVAVLAGLFLYGNAVAAKPGKTPAATSSATPTSSAPPASSAPPHAL